MEKETKKILIMEDEVALARALEIKLKTIGMYTFLAFNGQEGIEEIRKNPYDLILLDIMMPEVDGWEVLEYLSKHSIKTRVVITSNLSQEEDISRAKNFGVVDFVVKSNTTLSSIVEKITELTNNAAE
jgi:DNA-binding response OmpR family regulator